MNIQNYAKVLSNSLRAPAQNSGIFQNFTFAASRYVTFHPLRNVMFACYDLSSCLKIQK